MAGRAMLAIAVSSEAIASAVKIAATAHRLRSVGRPSSTGVGGRFAAVASADILQGSPDRRYRGLTSRGVYTGCQPFPSRRAA